MNHNINHIRLINKNQPDMVDLRKACEHMEIRCPICDLPVVEYTSDVLNDILRSESYQCVQPTHEYRYAFLKGGACEQIKTNQMTIMVRSHYTDTLDLVKDQQAILKHAIQLAKNTMKRRG